MRRHSIALLGGVWILSLLIVNGVAHAQPVIPTELKTANAIDEAGKVRIDEYLRYWFSEMTLDSSVENRFRRIQQAKQRLISNIFSTTVSAAFRAEYARQGVDHVQRILDGTDDRAAVDALLVASRLGTDPALEQIIEQLASSSPVRRCAAAGRARLAVRDFANGLSLVSDAKITTLGREAADAARDETDGIALQRQLELLNDLHLIWAVNKQQPSQAAAVHAARLSVLDARARSMSPASADAVNIMLGGLKTWFISARQDGTKLAKSLRTIISAIENDWDEAQASEAERQAYHRLLEQSQNFLEHINTIVNSGGTRVQTDLPGHWERKNHPAFLDDWKKWQAVLDGPPFNSGG